MGGRTSELQSQSTPSSLEQNQRLNTKDLEEALDTVFSLGKPRSENGSFALFEFLVDAGKAMLSPLWSNQEFQEFLQSDFGKFASAQLVRCLDADGDGRVTARDFQIMYDRDIKKSPSTPSGHVGQGASFYGSMCLWFCNGACRWQDGTPPVSKQDSYPFILSHFLQRTSVLGAI
ncbi:hypothetical protein TcCL_ESM12285 [Trypanosoma cruzi]|nr:hypothetical protein TcCL_ESM12285 [Trypanosoma cruzi]